MRRGCAPLLAALALLAGPAALAEPEPAPAQPTGPDRCIGCHAELPASRLREPAQQLRDRDVHAARGLGCTACHGGDANTTNAQVAHSQAFAAHPTSGEATAQVCGKCHAPELENWLKGPHHLANAPRKPDCATCHGSHGIGRASLELISEPLCTSCHTLPQARRIQKALIDAEREVAGLDEQLVKNQIGGPPLQRLRDARASLRGFSHSLDLLAITRNAAQALNTVEEVRAKALPQLGGRDWGRILRIAGLVLLALLVVAVGAGVIGRFLWARRHHLPTLSGMQLRVVGVTASLLLVGGSVAAYRTQHYIEHDPRFCTSCHTMGSAYELWAKSGHKNVECHACHIPDTASNLHQLWVYTTERPDVVVKHAVIDRAICEKCHSPGGESRIWQRVAETPGHRVHVGKERIECIQCHAMSVHTFKPPKETCVTCHKQTTMKAAGTMAEMHCMECHPFLASDAKRPLKPDRAACLDCHEQKQVAGEVFPAGKTPMKWDCGRCHKPHEKINLTAPDCVKCHDTIVEGVHKVKSHANCLDCHKPHGWSTELSSCTGCHRTVDPKKHHPGKSCTECHGAWDN